MKYCMEMEYCMKWNIVQYTTYNVQYGILYTIGLNSN